MPNRDTFRVAYRYRRSSTGSWTRADRHGNVSQWPIPPARSETGVLAYLRHVHGGAEVLIERLTWDADTLNKKK